MPKQDKINYVKQVAPFLREIPKEETIDINSKRKPNTEDLSSEDELDPKNIEEKPQIVVLKDKHISEAELNEINKLKNLNNEKQKNSFISIESKLTQSKHLKKATIKRTTKKVKNKNLLSFNPEE